MQNQIKYNFGGSKVLVTGGSSGIGLEIVKRFLAAEAEVIIWDYSPTGWDQNRAELEKLGRVYFAKVDISDRASIAAAVAGLPGKINVLVNNAGITRDKSFAKMNDQDWDAVIQTNLTGLYNVTKALIDQFAAEGLKRIVNIASIVGIYGNFGQANYASAKAGVIGFTKTLAREYARKGFTVNAVAPGFIQTPMTAAMPPEALSAMTSKIPVQRLGLPSDIANAVTFLSSSDSSYITGTVIQVDGGLVL